MIALGPAERVLNLEILSYACLGSLEGISKPEIPIIKEDERWARKSRVRDEIRSEPNLRWGSGILRRKAGHFIASITSKK